jgi:16S rRNA (cytosine967-C5)-methyltransferase
VRLLPGFADGGLSVQDAAAQLAVELLQARPGEHILDACAAPGGKTCHLLERLDGRCEVTALDVSEARLSRVRENLERLGLTAEVRAGDAETPAAWWDGRPFDRILLDVPCSATGVIRRHPDIKVLRRARDIPALARRQAALLRAAWGLLAPGGTLLYTSCSILRAENEAVVGPFLATTPEAADATAGLTRGWPQPPGAGSPGHQLLPGQAGMDGFYYACLVRRH